MYKGLVYPDISTWPQMRLTENTLVHFKDRGAKDPELNRIIRKIQQEKAFKKCTGDKYPVIGSIL